LSHRPLRYRHFLVLMELKMKEHCDLVEKNYFLVVGIVSCKWGFVADYFGSYYFFVH
jgi:hypothetical protein